MVGSMLRSLLLLLSLAVSPLLAAVISTGGDNNNGARWDDGSKDPYSFGALDADGDGRLTNAEMAKAREQFATVLKETKASLIGAVDRDNSGKLSLYESAEAMPRWISLRERARDLAIAGNDRNGDGTITPDEAKALQERIGRVFVAHGAKGVDTNHDQNISRAEVDAAIAAIKEGKGALFELCDINNDGQLSVQEVDMAFELLAAAAGP